MLAVSRFSLIALFVVWSSCCQASTMELLRNVNGTLLDPTKKFDRAARRETAKAFLAYWRSFSDRVPRLPPKELSWLTEELNAGSERAVAVANRKEYALWSLAQKADVCVNIYTRLSLPEDRGPLYEMYLWAKSINCYREGDQTLGYLA
jgi:hypothetical protein